MADFSDSPESGEFEDEDLTDAGAGDEDVEVDDVEGPEEFVNPWSIRMHDDDEEQA